MKERYYQLTQAQRYMIETLIKSGKNQTQVANLLNVHRSTISRELRRNTPQRGAGAKVYVADSAHYKTWERHHTKAKQVKFTLPLKNQMMKWMARKRYSPEFIAAKW
ncbi:MAG: helix-turn-helix domain-containing protein, partial [Bacteroidia bacterium]|nr:helix-turn-helix domain-containing protein [Bacteroidia bacterium]